MTTVKQLLDTKGYRVWTIAPDDSVFEAIRVMAEREVGALAVGDVVGHDAAREALVAERTKEAVVGLVGVVVFAGLVDVLVVDNVRVREGLGRVVVVAERLVEARHRARRLPHHLQVLEGELGRGRKVRVVVRATGERP